MPNRRDRKRYPAARVRKVAEKFHAIIKPVAIRSEIAGSLRRGKKTVADIDIVCIPTTEVYKELEKLIFAGGDKRMSGVYDDIEVQVWMAQKDQWGAMMLYATGSHKMNIAQRAHARARGMLLNQYGVWKDEQCLASETEEDCFKALGLQFVPPVEREFAKLIPIGDKNIKVVQIDGTKETHYVEINMGTGDTKCSCPHFRFRLARKGEKCRHIKEAIGQKWDPESIVDKLNDQKWLERAIMAIYERQTEKEQDTGTTISKNSMGFNNVDAKTAKIMADWIRECEEPWGNKLNEKWLNLAKKIMPKYANQLVEIANANEVKKLGKTG